MLAREYLREHGYTKTSEALREEVGKGLERLELADNVDLGSVVREFEAYYAMRLGKPPRLTRRRANDEHALPAPPRRRKGGSTAASAPAPASANAQPAKPRAGKEREIPNFYLPASGDRATYYTRWAACLRLRRRRYAAPRLQTVAVVRRSRASATAEAAPLNNHAPARAHRPAPEAPRRAP